MNLKAPYHFFDLLRNDKLSFIYQGGFSDEITPDILRLNENTTSNEGSEVPKIKNRIAFLIAECFQNIIRHGDKPEIKNTTNNKPEMFVTRNINGQYFISSTNLIDNEKVDDLKRKLENISKLSKEELKKLSLQSLSDNKMSNKGGAGLGLIEMARKSDQKIAYDFEWINFYLSLFFVQIALKVADKNAPVRSLNIQETKDFYNLMFKENVTIVYKEDFSQKTILPVLSMVEVNLKQEMANVALKKRVFYLLVELLQNVIKHAYAVNNSQQGIFVMSKEAEKYKISTGNYIKNEDVDDLKVRLDTINKSDREQLTEMYRNGLVNNKTDEKGCAGLGFIEMGRYSSEKIQYDFMPVDNNISFFTLYLTI